MPNNAGANDKGQGQGQSPGEVNSEKENRNDDEESLEYNAVSYRWLDEGITHADDGRVYHNAVQLTTEGRSFQVRKGDAVLLFSDESDWGAQWPCRVERMWEPAQNSIDPDPRPVLFTARWFWHKGDLKQLPYKWKGSLSRDELVARMAVDEVVLSNHLDENEIATIEGPCYMNYHVASENRNRPKAAHLPKSFQCQYKVDIMPGNSKVKLLSMTTEDKRFFARNLTEDQRQAIQDQRRALLGQEGGVDENDNGGGAAFGNEEEESEGGGDDVQSRKPKVAWKPQQLSETALHDFLIRLADLHTPYLSHHRLTTQEPYSPLPIKRAEELMRKMPSGKSLTGSPLSTACIKRNALLKDCNIDAALELLHAHLQLNRATIQ
jgi:hypothetical protein